MRKCWNWQTGMTKDHVVLHREGSSPFFRIGKRETERRQFWFRAVFYVRTDKNPIVWGCTVFGVYGTDLTPAVSILHCFLR